MSWNNFFYRTLELVSLILVLIYMLRIILKHIIRNSYTEKVIVYFGNISSHFKFKSFYCFNSELAINY